MPIGERIEEKPKRVIILSKKGGGMFVSEANIDPKLYAGNIATIRSCILAGTPIPDRFYRSTTCKDWLFADQGWIHLHVDLRPPDDVLLLVQEEEEGVIFINLTRHTIFEEQPRGKSAFGLKSKIAAAKLELKPKVTAPTKKK